MPNAADVVVETSANSSNARTKRSPAARGVDQQRNKIGRTPSSSQPMINEILSINTSV